MPPNRMTKSASLPFRLTVAEALNAAFVGEIDDAVTVAALFRFAVAEGYLTFEGAGAR
jgi:hypothetical protein